MRFLEVKVQMEYVEGVCMVGCLKVFRQQALEYSWLQPGNEKVDGDRWERTT